MELSEALDRTSINRLTEFSSLSYILKPDIIESCLQYNGVVRYTPDTKKITEHFLAPPINPMNQLIHKSVWFV